jgi:hypothetical protein
MLDRLSSRDYRQRSHSNMPAVITIKLHLQNDSTKFFLATMLLVSSTYSEREK